MSFLGNIILAFAKVLSLLMNLYTFILVASAVISWIQADPYNPIVRFINSMTQPVLSRLRRFLPTFLLKGPIDWTPLIALLLLVFLEQAVAGNLTDLGYSLRYGNSIPHYR